MTPTILPQRPARMGWTDVPLLDAQELDVAGGMPRVIRVLVHVETDRARADIRHVYLGRRRGAAARSAEGW